MSRTLDLSLESAEIDDLSVCFDHLKIRNISKQRVYIGAC
jgi:hypothetical protein